MNKLITLFLLGICSYASAQLPIDNLLVPRFPSYPQEALNRQVTGQVKIGFDISKMGKPENIVILESPNKIFDLPCIESIKMFRFKPTLSGGKIVGVEDVVVGYDFKLDIPTLIYTVHLTSLSKGRA